MSGPRTRLRRGHRCVHHVLCCCGVVGGLGRARGSWRLSEKGWRRRGCRIGGGVGARDGGRRRGSRERRVGLCGRQCGSWIDMYRLVADSYEGKKFENRIRIKNR